MKRFNKFIKYLGLIIILVILFRGFLFRVCFSYSKVGVRQNIILTDKKLINEINFQTNGTILNIEEIIDLSNKITSERLAFTLDKVSSNPNNIYQLKKANCIGYSSLFNSIGNYVINKQNLTNKYEFNHLIGKLYFLGFNIHTFFNNPFFKNHDFNEIRNKKTGKKIFVDPILNDYLRIKNISSK